MKLRFFLLIIILVISASETFAQENAASSIRKDASVRDMKYLSSDELQGRGTGSAGNDAAAAYISTKAQEAGLKPLPGQKDLFQTLKYLKIKPIADSSFITVTDTTGAVIVKSHVTPVMSPNDRVSFSGDVVFAGYGFMNSVLKYNDFQGLTIKDKIVLIMTREPDLEGTGLPNPGDAISESVETRKLPFLIFLQPKAIVYVTDPALPSEDGIGVLPVSSSYQLVPLFKNPMFNIALNIYTVSRETAEKMLASSGHTLAELQNIISVTKKPASFQLSNTKASVLVGVEKDTVTSNNVAGYLEGSDPVLKEECVIYTAHYDHMGVTPSGVVMNGANDNASGTVGLLNVARAFGSLEKKPLRSVVFLWTTGEEVGLHGSSYYVENPLFPLDKTVADINFDMIARSRMKTDSGKSLTGNIDITGNDTIKIVSARDCEILLQDAKSSCLHFGLYPIDEGKGEHFSGSDHYPFYRKGIPAVFFFTGLHKDYHQATDDFEFIDFEKLLKVSKAGFLTGIKIANTTERPVITKK